MTKAYSSDNKVELKTSAGGVTYTAEGVVGAKCASPRGAEASARADLGPGARRAHLPPPRTPLSPPSSPPYRSAALALKGEFKAGNIKFDKVSVSSKDEIIVEFSNDTLLKSTKLFFKSADSSRSAGSAGLKVNAGAEYKAGNLFSSVEADLLSLKSPVTADAVFLYDGFLVGAQVKLGLTDFKPADYNAVVGYKGKGVTFAVQTDDRLAGATVGLLQEVSDKVNVAGKASFKVAAPKAFDLEAGLSYKSTADQTVHAKVNSKGTVGVSFAHTLSAMSKLTLSASVDAANLGSDSHKLGMKLELSA